jgi:glutaredoxin 1
MKIEIYGAEWCNFCKQAKVLCETKLVDFDYIDIDDTANMRSLEERVGGKVRSVPQIFMDGQLIPSGFTGLKQELAKN